MRNEEQFWIIVVGLLVIMGIIVFAYTYAQSCSYCRLKDAMKNMTPTTNVGMKNNSTIPSNVPKQSNDYVSNTPTPNNNTTTPTLTMVPDVISGNLFLGANQQFLSGNTQFLKGNGMIGDWTPPGWTALWDGGNAIGGVGVDQVFHISWQEGEFGKNGINYDEPALKDTDNRLGGGFSWGALPEPTVSAPEDNSYQKVNGDLTFYSPGAFMYGPDTYVPSYVDSVLLSPMLGVNAPVHQDWSQTRKGTSWTDGIDENGNTYNRYQKWLGNQGNDVCQGVEMGAIGTVEREKYCQTLDTKTCGTKKCCVSLGGSFCMAGNEQGPLNQTAYTNPMYTNTEYYIHNGKCYGKCPPYLGLDLRAVAPPKTGTFQEDNMRFGDKTWAGPLNLNDTLGNLIA